MRRGRIVSWNRPVQRAASGHWESTIEIESEAASATKDYGDDCARDKEKDSRLERKKLRLVTTSAEDHVWITRSGTWLEAGDLHAAHSEDSFTITADMHASWMPSFGACVNAPRYVDLEPMRIMGFKPELNQTCVFVFRRPPQEQVSLICLDPKKASELIQLGGLGAVVSLYNVKWSPSAGQLFLTSASGVRLVTEKADDTTKVAIVVAQPQRSSPRKCKWHCLNCGYLNFPSKAVCLRCNCNRRDEPLPPDWIPRKAKQDWCCRHCHFENYFTNESCWKCGQRKRGKKREMN